MKKTFKEYRKKNGLCKGNLKNCGCKEELKRTLFVPFDQVDFSKGKGGADYLNEVIFLLIEQVNRLGKEIKKLA